MEATIRLPILLLVNCSLLQLVFVEKDTRVGLPMLQHLDTGETGFSPQKKPHLQHTPAPEKGTPCFAQGGLNNFHGNHWHIFLCIISEKTPTLKTLGGN